MAITVDDRRTRRVYHLISADSHVNEPPDLWTTRLPHQFAARAPRMERFEQGDAWIFEGVDAPIPFGLNACVGMDPAMRKPGSVRRSSVPEGTTPRPDWTRSPSTGRRRGVLPHSPVVPVILPLKPMPTHTWPCPGLQRLAPSTRLRHVPVSRDRYCPTGVFDGAPAGVERVGERPGIGGFCHSFRGDHTATRRRADDARLGLPGRAGDDPDIHVALVRGACRHRQHRAPPRGRAVHRHHRAL